jgi:hypothetical protein
MRESVWDDPSTLPLVISHAPSSQYVLTVLTSVLLAPGMLIGHQVWSDLDMVTYKRSLCSNSSG